MRLVLYVVTVLAGVYALRLMAHFAAWLPFQAGRLPIQASYAIFYAMSYTPFALLLARGFIWYQRRRIAPPASFSGIPFVLVCLMALLLLAAVGIYVAYGIAGTMGVSGVPLAFLLMGLGIVTVPLVLFVEVRDWLAFRDERRVQQRQ